MNLQDKLQMLMARHNLNGQRLARRSAVSDSEISRILQGKSRPGLDNAFRLAKAVGVSLDYLADDDLDAEPPHPGDLFSPEEKKILSIAQRIGYAEVLTILEAVRFTGYEVAMSRLVRGRPIVEVEKVGSESGAIQPQAVAAGSPSKRASSTAG
jgi:transcriptional regulator with XRE-family HTH domain